LLLVLVSACANLALKALRQRKHFVSLQRQQRRGRSDAKGQRYIRQQGWPSAKEKETDEGQAQKIMCSPDAYRQMGSMQSGGMKLPRGSLGARLDQAQRSAMSTSGGGTYQGRTIMQGVPRNTDVQAIRRTTMLGV